MGKHNKKKLYKSVIVIWTDYNPNALELVDLAHAATNGDAICTQQTASLVDAKLCPRQDFFNLEDGCAPNCDHNH